MNSVEACCLTHDGQNGHQPNVELATELTLGDMVDFKNCLLTSAFGVGVVDDAILFVVFRVHGNELSENQRPNLAATCLQMLQINLVRRKRKGSRQFCMIHKIFCMYLDRYLTRTSDGICGGDKIQVARA